MADIEDRDRIPLAPVQKMINESFQKNDRKVQVSKEAYEHIKIAVIEMVKICTANSIYVCKEDRKKMLNYKYMLGGAERMGLEHLLAKA